MGKMDVYLLDKYDPKALGAKCDQCIIKIMREYRPVPPEYHENSVASVVTDFPRKSDQDTNRPLTGTHGIEFVEHLKKVGIKRTQVDLHHAVACMPPEADLEKVMLKWQRWNKQRAKAGEELLPSPIECCRPRLLVELEHPNVISLGKVPFQALTQRNKPINDIRGGPVAGAFTGEGDYVASESPIPDSKMANILPTLHPGFVQHNRRWTKAFQSDLSRAFRWFSGHLGWRDPHIWTNPSPELLEQFLSSEAVPYVVDLETTFDDPLMAKLKCVGIGTEDQAVVIHLLSIEGPGGRLVEGSYYRSADELEIRGILRNFFADPNKLKAGHNAGYFDALVIKKEFGVYPRPMLDTILLHRSVESELPHKLGYVGSVYTDVTSWKEAHTAQTAGTDKELGHYCAIDCVVTARALPKLAEAAQLRQQGGVVQFDHRIQEVCVGLHETGMFIDLERREEESNRLQKAMNEWGFHARGAAGRSDMNLNSTMQLRDLLFTDWNLAPTDYTKLGDPSTSDEALRLLRTANRENVQVCNFIDALRKFRRYSKEFGTYVKRLVPYTGGVQIFAKDDFDENEEGELDEVDSSQTDTAANKKRRGLILPDGRVHPDYNAHGTTSGRLSSSNPNAQNWPKHLRGMVIPQPGNIIVGADADQLELRIIAAVAGIERYLEVFHKGGDPHAETAAMMFGKAFTDLVPKSEQWDKIRKIAKGIKYASFYGSGDETVHNLVTSAEDENGNLLYPDLSVREVAKLRRNWLKNIPELQKWWDDTLDQYRNAGYILDPVLGRRRDFLDGEKFNEIVNFPIQCVPGWTRILTLEGYIPIDQLRGRVFSAWTGHKWAPARVLDRGVKELHRVYTKRGQHFVCDDAHQGKFVGREGYEWRKFVEAGQGARFALDLAREHEFGQAMDELDTYVAGYWTGDGSSTPDGHHAHAISFVVAHGEGPRSGAEMEAKLTRWAADRGIEMRRSEQVGCFNLTFHKGATEWLLSIGADPAWKAHTKRIPESIWRSNLAARKAFLRGLLDADGYATPDGGAALNLCQHALLQDTMILARTVGVEGAIHGPYDSDKKGHQSFRLTLNGSQTFTSLGWGREQKLRTSTTGSAPRFESKRVLSQLAPATDSERVIKSRIKTSGTPSASPYMLTRMGASDLYDHDQFTSCSSRRICVPVFTLEVFDEQHQYVAEGVISKNCAGAHIIHISTFDLLKEIPFGKWGPGTGLIAQVHDALYVECPESEAGWVADAIKTAMNRNIPGLPGVTFSAKPKAGMRWSDV